MWLVQPFPGGGLVVPRGAGGTGLVAPDGTERPVPPDSRVQAPSAQLGAVDPAVVATRGSAVLALGFALRVAAGPRLSPLGLLATRVVAPRLGEPRLVSGAPKRFAQGIGLTTTAVATVALALGAPAVAMALLAVIALFAALESGVGFCAGCWLFSLLIRAGVVSDDTCVECSDITLRRATTTA